MVRLRKLLRAVVVVGLALATSGCFLRLTLGNVIVRSIGEEVEQLIAAVFADATISVCEDYSVAGQHFGSCTYVFGGTEITSTEELVGELGLFGVLVDPLVVQIPANATDIRASYTRNGATTVLAVTEVPGSLQADATRAIVPEPGKRLIVIDFPAGSPPVAGTAYPFSLTFSVLDKPGTPLALKAMLTGYVATASGQVFYPPLLPCVTDFSLIPPITLARSAAPQPLDLTGAPGPRGCSNARYTIASKAIPTVDVVEYYNAALDHYFITWIPSEIAILDAGQQIRGWVRTGRIMKAYQSAQAGTSPICRYYLPPAFGDSHFFGRGVAECAATGAQHPQFVLEESSYLHVFLPNAGICPAGTRAVYRVFSNRLDANHRYMDDRALRDQMAGRGWLIEGDGGDYVVWCEPA